MPRYSVTGPLGPDAMDYEMVPGTDPLDALLTIHRNGPWPLERGALRASGSGSPNRTDRALCAGAWRVTTLAVNGAACETVIEILRPGSGGRRENRQRGPY